ncbi:shikimate dehydrogenase [Companilactobacillus jidongensis]|uniref:shikimate dehydrogenase n=1 Tax=Companilactobacillus jidongensis TaxID=2486006 RepID=UPI000F7BAE18|nr:shikimate dehydrogenase [Companilactobacillus jidongensis]
MEQQLYGLIGFPAMHSKSPRMHNAAMKKLNINAKYQAFEFSPNQLSVEVERLRHLNIQGFNVTMPFKNKIIDYLDGIDDLANQLQSVNTVQNVNGKWIGHSTDGNGFWQTINSHPKTVVLIGSGGAARSILASKPNDVTIHVFNHHSVRFKQHAKEIKKLKNIELEDLANIRATLPETNLVINATNVGMRDDASILSKADFELMNGGSAVDIIYRDQPTKFLEYANSAGLKTKNGLDMLVSQGALSFEIWFRQKAPIELMNEVVNK